MTAKNLLSRFTRPSASLLTEFVVIVLGVLAAFAVDEWKEARELRQLRHFLISALLEDLRDDAEDFTQFIEDQAQREAAAMLLVKTAEDLDRGSIQVAGLGEALYRIGRSTLLEVADGTFQEMTMHGTGPAISDVELRLKITRYYALARDRQDANAMVYSPIDRYRDALNDQGLSYGDRDDGDAVEVLRNPRVLALIREIGMTAAKVQRYDDLLAGNEELVAKLERAKSSD